MHEHGVGPAAGGVLDLLAQQGPTAAQIEYGPHVRQRIEAIEQAVLKDYELHTLDSFGLL